MPWSEARTPSGMAYAVVGQGPPLVLVHGLMARGAMFEPVVEALSADFRLVVPDLRGHGGSRGLGGPYTVKRSAADVVELLDHLQISATALLGYSHGGPVCELLAFEHPARVQSLVLACTYAHNAATPRERVESYVFEALAAALGGQRLARMMIREGAPTGGGPPLSPARVAWLRQVLGSASRAALVQSAREMRDFDSRPWLSSVTTPALIVAGAEDHAVPEHHFQMLTRALPHGTVRIVPGAGHTLVWTHGDVLAELVRSWLSSA